MVCFLLTFFTTFSPSPVRAGHAPLSSTIHSRLTWKLRSLFYRWGDRGSGRRSRLSEAESTQWPGPLSAFPAPGPLSLPIRDPPAQLCFLRSSYTFPALATGGSAGSPSSCPQRHSSSCCQGAARPRGPGLPRVSAQLWWPSLALLHLIPTG